LTDIIQTHDCSPLNLIVFSAIFVADASTCLQNHTVPCQREAGHANNALTNRKKMSKPPIVVFDLDGTLADTAQDLIATLNAVLESEGLAPLAFEKARDLIGAGAKPLIERGFAVSNKSLSDERLQTLYAFFLEHYHQNIAVHTTLFPGVLAAMTTLDKQGFVLAVCTNKLEAHALELLRTLNILDRFAFVSGKDSFAFFKPDPRHLTETIRLAGGAPSKAIMVGDSKTDIDTAKAAGIPVIGVTFGYTNVHVRDLGADYVIDHFDEMGIAVRACLDHFKPDAA
jgi:phosphoglycolate phosphatase